VVTFRCRDPEDLEEKVKILLSDIEKCKVRSCSLANDFIRIYEDLFEVKEN